MQVQLHLQPLPAWSGVKPLETYETRFLYLGFSRYNTEKKTLEQFDRRPEGHILFRSTPISLGVVSRCYHTEHARVTVYSTSPRVWSETLSPGETHFFIQTAQHVA